MEIRVHLKIKVNSDFENYVREKIVGLGKVALGPTTADFYLRKEGPAYVSELVIHTGHQTVFLKESDPELNRSVDELLHKARVKLSRLHDKVIDRSHRQKMKEEK
ncbi:MAG: HPF/RaiA family ribosome-associated protein [Candidatus Omnitrophica bacterium]|nr:HPF/RaiA family ribosome-associated protein [Candidatus Omnitrophota bacterium]